MIKEIIKLKSTLFIRLLLLLLLVSNGNLYSQSESFEESLTVSAPAFDAGFLLGCDFDKHLNFGVILKRDIAKNFGISTSLKFKISAPDSIPGDSAGFWVEYYYDRYSLLSLYIFYDVINFNKLKIGAEAGYSYLWLKYHTAKYVRRKYGGWIGSDSNIYDRQIILKRSHGIALKGRVTYQIFKESDLEFSYFYNDMHVKVHGLEFAVIINFSKK